MKTLIIITLSLLLSLHQCNTTQLPSYDEQTVVARVGSSYLYLHSLRQQMPENYKSEDSAQLSQSLVNQWVQEQLLLQQAENQLPDSLQDVEQQLQTYRNSLLIHLFKERWIATHLDTAVLASQIEQFYQAHQKEFLLKQNIIRFAYAKVPIIAEDLDTLSYMIEHITDTSIDRTQLESRCAERGYDSFLNTEQWLPLNEVAQQIPLELYNQETYLKNNHFVRIKDYPFWHLLRITDFKIKDEISPLDFERKNIKRIILQQRETQLLKQLSSDIYTKALHNNQIEVY